MKRRHEFSVHGFRKWYKTRCELGGMMPINVEILMSHSVGISDSYYRPTESELLADYLRVVDLISINDDKKKLQAEISEIVQKGKEEIHGIEGRLYEREQEIRLLRQR